MNLSRFAAFVFLSALAGCAYLPLGDAQRVQSEAPARKDSQAGARQDRPQVAYKRLPGQVDPKTQPYSVMGKTYWPVQSALGFREDGFASWYGIDFHGKKTATGEIYDMFSVSAAHKTLPLGTKVRVTNLENGRELELMINDRGPFVDGRVIDLSYASARLLGMADNGLARVRVEGIAENPVLAGGGGKVVASANTANAAPRRPKPQIVERTLVEEPAKPQVLAQAAAGPKPAAKAPQAERAPKAPKAEMAAKAENGKYAVQVGAFSQDENARRVQARLVQAGYGKARITRVVRGGKELLAVQAGSFEQRDRAEETLRSLKQEFPASFISADGA